MHITVLAICYNEEKILPFFLKHYASFADRIIIYDNYSTDRSVEIIKSCPKATVIRYSTNGLYDEKTIRHVINNEWKKYRKTTDWQITVAIDEFIYHPNLTKLLEKYKQEGITVPLIDGYNMIADRFPETYDKQIWEYIQKGVFNRFMCKSAVFDPKKIKEIHYGLGGHFSEPTGTVKRSEKSEILLLHYKYFGLDHFKARAGTYAPRLEKITYDCGQMDIILQQYADTAYYNKCSKQDQARQIIFLSPYSRMMYLIKRIPAKMFRTLKQVFTTTC